MKPRRAPGWLPERTPSEEVAEVESELRWQLDHGGIIADNFQDIRLRLVNSDCPTHKRSPKWRK